MLVYLRACVCTSLSTTINKTVNYHPYHFFEAGSLTILELTTRLACLADKSSELGLQYMPPHPAFIIIIIIVIVITIIMWALEVQLMSSTLYGKHFTELLPSPG